MKAEDNVNMKILDLILKGKWYDMIASGEKPEEYRDITHHWMQRLFLQGDYFYLWKPFHEYAMDAEMIDRLKNQIYGTSEMRFRDYDAVCFHRGYTKTTMTFAIKYITIGMGNPLWGAPTDKEIFIIKLGERYETRN